jgi:putative transposase
MSTMSVKAFKFRLHPTSKQHVALGAMLSAHAELYNAALQERRDAYKTRGVSVKATDQMKQLSEIREARPDQAVWSFTSQQQTLRRLDKAFQSFFRRIKTGDTPGYPRFRAAARFDSVDFRHGDGIKFIDDGKSRRSGRQREARLRVMGVGHIRVRLHRDLPPDAKLGQVSIKREGTGRRVRWFVVLPVEVPDEVLPKTGSVVGIDLGVAAFYADSNGHLEPNPRHAKKAAARLAVAQQELSRKKRGSTRRKLAVQRVARLHRKVAAQRLDHAHKTAHALVQHHDLIAHEALVVKNMVRRAKPVPDPDNEGSFLPNGGSAKTGLNRSISDAGWSQFISILTNKAACAGREIVPVNPTNTSRTCSNCNHVAPDNRATQDLFLCVSCGHTANADTNAAINILRAGLALHQATAA